MTTLPIARLVDDRDLAAAIAEVGLLLQAIAGVVGYVAVLGALTVAGAAAIVVALPIAATRGIWRAR